MIIQLMIENSKYEKSLKKLEDLYNYLISNRDGMIQYKKRDMNLPTALGTLRI